MDNIDKKYKELVFSNNKDIDYIIADVPQTKKRNTLMCYYRKALGWSYARIGLKFSVSREFVCQQCKDWTF